MGIEYIIIKGILIVLIVVFLGMKVWDIIKGKPKKEVDKNDEII